MDKPQKAVKKNIIELFEKIYEDRQFGQLLMDQATKTMNTPCLILRMLTLTINQLAKKIFHRHQRLYIILANYQGMKMLGQHKRNQILVEIKKFKALSNLILLWSKRNAPKNILLVCLRQQPLKAYIRLPLLTPLLIKKT